MFKVFGGSVRDSSVGRQVRQPVGGPQIRQEIGLRQSRLPTSRDVGLRGLAHHTQLPRFLVLVLAVAVVARGDCFRRVR
jgi:hypothetical protein